jgi:D-glycero-alpha-D-manno-heptose-7-phosphate kinase
MSVIFAKAPLRISLGGGGTDLPSYYEHREGFLIAGAINKYVYLLLHDVFQKRYRLKYSQLEEVDDPRDIKHPIFREVLTRYWDGEPVEIATVADIPTGTGLGSSGSFTVCLLKALATATAQSTTPDSLAEWACHVEINLLGEPIGKQDQYAASYGGICSYTFHRDGRVTVAPLHLSATTLRGLRENLLLFYTGETRAAGAILADQNKRTSANEDSMLENLDLTKQIGLKSRDLLVAGDLNRYGELLHEHWLNKRSRSPGMTSGRIDELYSVALKNGAIGGKIVGAGGGGFLLVYTPEPEKTRLAMLEMAAPEVTFDFDINGCVSQVFS